jgi:hypothetical protein
MVCIPESLFQCVIKQQNVDDKKVRLICYINIRVLNVAAHTCM